MPLHGPAIGEDTAPECELVALLKTCTPTLSTGSPRGQSAPQRNDINGSVYKATGSLSSAAPSPIAGPLAAWMPPSSPQGRVHGVSRERWGAAHPANQPVAASDKVRPTKPLR
ncbi:hypothetical protein D0A36_04685 [Xanthomonas campestris]|nr:hypothetical protein D0A41_06895 [Xanthomonas campestris]RFF60264.1 hypothetical protein D0A36_04685 [Xanthomonas campestris]